MALPVKMSNARITGRGLDSVTQRVTGANHNKVAARAPVDAIVRLRLVLRQWRNGINLLRYQLIYADPPWRYNKRLNGSTRFGRGARYYPLMKPLEICALPVKELPEDRAVLFLWATFPTLPEAFKVIEACGFRYSTQAFTWIKTNLGSSEYKLSYFFGTGYCTKSNAEVCLLAWRGKPIKPATDMVSSLIVAPRGQHSRKPDEARS